MKRSIVMLLAFAAIGNISAQELKGTITDNNNNPLVDAYIHNPSGTIHAHADINGSFLMYGLRPADTLMVSYLGYENYTKVITEQDIQDGLNIVLENKSFNLEQVAISNTLKQAYQVANIDLKVNPVNSSQEILQKVPGLFIGQHAGGGKAEQIFLRGFDIDHGTDISLSVDGLPVNMVSHAHGQGYSDLHFLIPETIESINFGKGPYYAESGNFTTAGYVQFKTKDKLESSKIGLEIGDFNTKRMFAIFDLLGDNDDQSAYIATEYSLSDGPVESPQNFNRLNIMGKYTTKVGEKDQFSILASRFTSSWDASGQIPQRLVDAGTITRFGSVDDTEGGQTSRTNVALKHTKVINENTFTTTSAYYSKYDFLLFSNFTFFLDFPEEGDQIRQSETRNIYGVSNKFHHTMNFENYTLNTEFGGGFRYDNVDDNELAYTLNRKTLRERLAFGNVDETNLNLYANAELEYGDWIINPGLRVDHFLFDYVDNLQTLYKTQSEEQTIVTPKFNILYNPSRKLQLFLKSGIGFHSNDSRVVVSDPTLQTLPAAFGVDLGMVYKPVPTVFINAALWYLGLQQEFVYVGDAGIVEPSGRTSRRGIELGTRVQITKDWYFDSDLSYSIARSLDDPEGENFIPLAPDLTAAGGLSYNRNNLSGGIRYKYIKDRPANEDNSITAEGYFIMDANVNYKIGDVTLGVSVDNLLNAEWNEAQFATESRLQNEVESVEELHFTPGAPLFVKGRITYEF